jgi:NADH-quinone oxidoreductase subunit E
VTFSSELEARFAELAGRYPPGYQRAALIPMLLYAQDEIGHITDELIAEIGKRLNLTVLQVQEVVSYYSMLRREPAGRRHIQICTNISCLLRGADRLWDHARRRLGLGNKQTSPDGRFSLEEVECIGACSWAPAIQVNYEFHHHMTLEKFDALLKNFETEPGSETQPLHETGPRPAESGR